MKTISRGSKRSWQHWKNSLKLFEEGTKLVHDCGAMLDKAEQKVAKLSKGADGAPVESPFISEE